MNEQNYFRTKLNTKQTAKGEYYVDVTTELKQESGYQESPEKAAKLHMLYLTELENAMIAAGKKLVGGK